MIAATGSDTAAATESPVRDVAPASDLERECSSYALYLSGSAPTRYVVEKYLDFHQKFGVQEDLRGFDAFLLALSARGAFWARLADGYASVWRKDSILRKKIVLTLALLECAPPVFEMLDRVPGGGFAGAVLRLGMAAVGYVLTLVIATAVFTPARLWIAARER
jgi:hypothetical protein